MVRNMSPAYLRLTDGEKYDSSKPLAARWWVICQYVSSIFLGVRLREICKQHTSGCQMVRNMSAAYLLTLQQMVRNMSLAYLWLTDGEKYVSSKPLAARWGLGVICQQHTSGHQMMINMSAAYLWRQMVRYMSLAYLWLADGERYVSSRSLAATVDGEKYVTSLFQTAI